MYALINRACRYSQRWRFNVRIHDASSSKLILCSTRGLPRGVSGGISCRDRPNRLSHPKFRWWQHFGLNEIIQTAVFPTIQRRCRQRWIGRECSDKTPRTMAPTWDAPEIYPTGLERDELTSFTLNAYRSGDEPCPRRTTTLGICRMCW